jgi:hypothetical protein
MGAGGGLKVERLEKASHRSPSHDASASLTFRFLSFLHACTLARLLAGVWRPMTAPPLHRSDQIKCPKGWKLLDRYRGYICVYCYNCASSSV